MDPLLILDQHELTTVMGNYPYSGRGGDEAYDQRDIAISHKLTDDRPPEVTQENSIFHKDESETPGTL